MNIHPVFTHFPIALFSVYAILEILRFKKIQSLPYIFNIKGFLVITGTLFSFITLKTGQLASMAFKSEPSKALIQTHSTLANISVYIFLIISLVYFFKWVDLSPLDTYMIKSPFRKIWIAIKKHTGYILRSPFLPLLALVGLVSITMTGALGGALVYGPNVDPIVKFVYNLFF